MRISALMVTALAISGVISGCAPVVDSIESEDIVGLWKCAPQGQVEIAADGTFSVRNFPAESVVDIYSAENFPELHVEEGDGSLSSSGRWSIIKGFTDAGRFQEFRLNFKEGALDPLDNVPGVLGEYRDGRRFIRFESIESPTVIECSR